MNQSKNQFTGYMLLVACCCLLNSCGTREVGVRDYVKHMSNKKNGLVQKKEVDGLLFEVRYVTPELMVLKEFGTEEINAEKYKQALKEYEGLNYYVVKVSATDEEYVYNVLQQESIEPLKVEEALNFGMQQNILEIQGADTAACVLYQMSKTYGLSKTYDMEVAVANNKIADDISFEINTGILNRGLLKFRFEKEALNKIPSLIF